MAKSPPELITVDYVMKITIKDIDPPIWRRLKVPGDVTFARLHRLIQAAFGWLNYHEYRFGFVGFEVIEEDPDFPEDVAAKGVKRLHPRKTHISSLFEAQPECVYEYDFGDFWEHQIVIESAVDPEQGPPAPVCLAGARRCPPEDIGGTGGYEEFLADDTGGGRFDPEDFSLEEANRRVEVAKGKRVKRG